MPKIDKALLILDAVTTGGSEGCIRVDRRVLLLVTIVYLGVMLSVPTTHVDLLLWFAVYPIVASPMLGLSYSSVFLQSLIVLPLVILLGIFNPIVDKVPVAAINGFSITEGWLLFAGIIIRGLLSMQALVILIRSIGFVGIVRSMSGLGIPGFLTTQLMMVFRYIRVLIEEGVTMKAARDSRSFGNGHLSVRMWGILIGQLFLRSVHRAERVHKAMLARGFSGEVPFTSGEVAWNWNSTVYLLVWSTVFVFLRLYNISLLFV